MKATSFPREYRAWSFDDRKMYYGDDLLNIGVLLAPNGLPYFIKKPHEIVLTWFTGFLDRSGKKVFEGDILKIEVPNEFGSSSVDYGIMKWSDEARSFILMVPSPFPNQAFQVTNAEKIGNEFENTELIPLITKENGK